MNNLKIAKSLKLSIDNLGYAVTSEGLTNDRSCYRCYLRSGKQDKIKQTSDNRQFQTINFYQYYFSKDHNCLLRCDYKNVISCLLNIEYKKYFKGVEKVSKNLLNKNCFEVYKLPSGSMVKDLINNHMFYYDSLDRKVYRVNDLSWGDTSAIALQTPPAYQFAFQFEAAMLS